MPVGGASFKWQKPPADLISNLDKYEKQVAAAILSIAEMVAAEAEADMKANAPWQDQTGQARAGLFAIAQQFAKDSVEIYLGHTVDYGVFLELARSGRYAIIGPTLLRIQPLLMSKLQEAFSA